MAQLNLAGRTRINCTALVEEKVNRFKRPGLRRGECRICPVIPLFGSSSQSGKIWCQHPQTEIRRLLGLTLQPMVDLQTMEERIIMIACGEVQADGGSPNWGN